MSAEYTCPVCSFPHLEEPAYIEEEATFVICPSCGTEFGYDDVTKSFEQLRAQWVDAGCPWWGGGQEKPRDWNPECEKPKRAGEQA